MLAGESCGAAALLMIAREPYTLVRLDIRIGQIVLYVGPYPLHPIRVIGPRSRGRAQVRTARSHTRLTQLTCV